MSVEVFALLTLLAVTHGAHLGSPVLKNDGRIIGGAKTTIENNPWQVSIQTFGIHSCGGSIISPDWVLSAAHCVNWLFTPFYVIVAGTNDLRQEGIRSGVRETHTHNKYKGNSNDVGLFKLSNSLQFTSKIRPIPLALSEPQANANAFVTGFGLLHENDWLTPVDLYGVDLSIIGRDICRTDYQGLQGADIDDTMVCAGVTGGGKDSCQGDSGGPLTQNGTLIGIVSWGYGCALPKYPGVYTNVASVRDWIRATAGV